MKHPGSYEAIKTLSRFVSTDWNRERILEILYFFQLYLKNLYLTHSCISHLLQTSIIIFTCRQNTTPTAENTNYRHTRNTPHIRIMSRTIIKVIILYKFFKAPTQRLGLYTMGKVIVSVVEMR